MPSSGAILDTAALIADEWRGLAVMWHAAILGVVIYVWCRRPDVRTAALLLIVPLLSVSALAWWSRNPFTGVSFVLLAVVLVVAAVRMDARAVALAPPPDVAAGLLIFAFGFAYPHFLGDSAWYAHLYESPFGLLPCPTLAVVCGMSLMFGAFGSRLWSGALAAALLIYGAIGVMALGVWIDAMLITGAALLAHTEVRRASLVGI